MTGPACRAEHCAGVADDGTGLCGAHRRSLTLTTKLQDAVREFLQGGHCRDAIRPTPDNARKVVEAGEHFAQGLACLISTRFDDVRFDPSPIYAINLSLVANQPPWRVSFAWNANEIIESDDETEDELDDDERIEADEP